MSKETFDLESYPVYDSPSLAGGRGRILFTATL